MSDTNSALDQRQRVAKVIAEHVAPLLHMDGSAIEVVSVEKGVVQVRLGGVCGCCPGSVQAVILSLEDELRRHIPEIEYLEAVL